MSTGEITISGLAHNRRYASCALATVMLVSGQATWADMNTGPVRWYVDAQATVGGNGTSWAKAFRDLRDGLEIAFEGDEVWVARGIYRPDRGTGARDMAFTIPAHTKIYGGFGGNETRVDQRAPRTFVTTLSGDLNDDDGPDFANRADNSHHVLRISNAGTETLVAGFTITAGNADGSDPFGNGSGGGVFSSGGITIRNSVFVDNSARLRGGGLFNLDGSPMIFDCIFIANRAGFGGGVVAWGTGFARGAALLHGTVSLTSCIFFANHAIERGGAMFTTGGSENVIANGCAFIANSTDGFGGAMVNDGISHILTSCLFIANTAVGRAGAVSNGTITKLNGCTLVFNTASEGGAIHSDFFHPSLTGCIVWGNSDKFGIGQSAQIAGPTPIINSSCVQGLTGTWGGFGNIGDDPELADPSGLDGVFGTIDDSPRLLGQSPCINSGHSVPGPFDLDGHARILCGQTDMGAFEFGIGDIDCNGIVELADYAEWGRCLANTHDEALAENCRALDFDADQDVDLIDFAAYQRAVGTSARR